MLVLSRKVGEAIVIAGQVRVVVAWVRGGFRASGGAGTRGGHGRLRGGPPPQDGPEPGAARGVPPAGVPPAGRPGGLRAGDVLRVADVRAGGAGTGPRFTPADPWASPGSEQGASCQEFQSLL